MADFGTDPVSCNDIFNKEVMLKTNKQEPQLPSYSHQEIKGSQVAKNLYLKYYLGPQF